MDDELPAFAGSRERSDRPEVGEIFDAHGSYVARALRCLGVRDPELPDLVQEVFLVVHQRWADFEGRSSLRTWLYGICVRKVLHARRRAARRREDSVEAPEAGRAAPGATPHDELEKARALEAAFAILDRIDDDKRAVFVLFEVEQLSMNEVAAIVGCPPKTGYSRLHAARREIAEHLKRMRARGRVE